METLTNPFDILSPADADRLACLVDCNGDLDLFAERAKLTTIEVLRFATQASILKCLELISEMREKTDRLAAACSRALARDRLDELIASLSELWTKIAPHVRPNVLSDNQRIRFPATLLRAFSYVRHLAEPPSKTPTPKPTKAIQPPPAPPLIPSATKPSIPTKATKPLPSPTPSPAAQLLNSHTKANPPKPPTPPSHPSPKF
jgi:hypothetical protein